MKAIKIGSRAPNWIALTSKYSSIFKTPEDEAKYMAAYEAVLALWPVPHESFDVPTRFGKTHVIASGPKEAQLSSIPALAQAYLLTKEFDKTFLEIQNSKYKKEVF